MSSTSPVPNITGILGQPRRMSNTFQMNPLTLAGGTTRSSTPPTSTQQQSQASPNSFLQGLSSRLRSQQVPGMNQQQQNQVQQQQTQQQQQLPSYQMGLPRAAGGIMDIFDSASIAGPGSSSASFGFRNIGQNFGIPTSSGPPSTFDINEFPSLSGGGGLGNSLIGGSAPGSNRPNYVGQLVKDVHSSAVDFNKPAFDMNYNDFPALPGAPAKSDGSASGSLLSGNSENGVPDIGGQHGSIGPNAVASQSRGPSLDSVFNYQTGSPGSQIPRTSILDGNQVMGTNFNTSNNNLTKSGKKGIITTKEGKVMNIPMGMVTDQFGMIGLLTFIRSAETEKNIVSLALGTDLTSLKLDLTSPDPLYSSFPGPWSDSVLKPHEMDYQVPSEYLCYNQVRDKIAPIREKLTRYADDTLFFLFYMFPNDLLQIAAANELYTRDWRYHKDEKVWITRAPGMPPQEKTTLYERGTYYFFDPNNWRRVAKEFHLDYDRLENKPANPYLHTQMNNSNSNSMGPSSVAPSGNLMTA